MKSKFNFVAAILLAAVSLPTLAATHAELLGQPAPASAANRTFTIDANTKYVNVEGGEVVQFVVNGKSVTWHFDNPMVWALPLAQIMPADAPDQKVMVYVSRNPIYDSP